MTPFTHHRPASLAEALDLLAVGGSTRILAGGQSLLLALKERQIRPSAVVSITALPEMQGWRYAADGTLEIGPGTTYAALSRAKFSGWHAELTKVAGNLADRSVRNMGTIGGGICQADPRYDMPTLMSAAGATLTLASAKGTRSLTTGDFFNPAGGTSIAADEILTRISLPPIVAWSALAFEKFRFRTFDAAIVTVACAVTLNNEGVIERVRLVVGAVGKAPSVAINTACALGGKKFTNLATDDVARKVSREVLPLEAATTRQKQYQAELTISLMKRALGRLASVTGDVS